MEQVLVRARQLVPQFDTIIEKNENLAKKRKEGFNIFSCLTKHHKEELHTRFLRFLLNPFETHNCGSFFLRQFITVLKEDNRLLRSNLLPNVTDEELEVAVVETKDKYSEEYGKMDIFIETSTAIFVIENKIKAGEQDEQILRYVTYCEERCLKENKKFLVLYLTLNGYDSKQSGGKLYFSISYYNHIRKWISKCLEVFKDFEMVSVGLRYYLNMLESNILHLSINKTTVEIKDLLLKEDNKIIIKHLHELHHVLVPLRNELRLQFFKKVYNNLIKKGFDFIPINHIVNSIDIDLVWSELYRGFKLVDESYSIKTAPNKSLYFCIEHDWDNLYFGLVPIETNPVVVDFEMDKELKDIYEKLNGNLNLELGSNENCWMAYKNTSICPKDKFGDDSLNYLFATQMDKFVDDFVVEIERYLLVLKDIITERNEFKTI